MADDPRVARRRSYYKPARVVILLIGESAPAGGTHYYLANSHLFRGIRNAVWAIHRDATPDGKAFLKFAKQLGIWLVDLASQPVNWPPNADRKRLTERGTARVARIIRSCRPAVVVAVKMSIEGQVQDAVTRSGLDLPLHVLHFPAQGWQNVFHEEFVPILESAQQRPEAVPGG